MGQFLLQEKGAVAKYPNLINPSPLSLVPKGLESEVVLADCFFETGTRSGQL